MRIQSISRNVCGMSYVNIIDYTPVVIVDIVQRSGSLGCDGAAGAGQARTSPEEPGRAPSWRGPYEGRGVFDEWPDELAALYNDWFRGVEVLARFRRGKVYDAGGWAWRSCQGRVADFWPDED